MTQTAASKPRSVAFLSLAAATAMALAGCAGQHGSDANQEADVVYSSRVHKNPVRDSSSPTPNVASAHLTYYGGPVLSNVKVVQVLYGSGTYATGIASGTPSMASFYTGVTNSTYMDWLSEYNTPTQTIGRGTFAGTVNITPASSRNGSTITDASIQAEIAAQINTGVLPAPDANTIYMINFPKGKAINQGGSNSCVSGGFCAYHGTFTRNSQDVFYGVLPDMSSGSGCDTGCGNDPTPFNNQTSVASHELIEAVTDAAVGLATSNAAPLAWYDSTNGEIGDICNASQGSVVGGDGRTYVVQKEWSNAQNACVTQGTTASSNFSLALSPSSNTVSAGSSVSFTVTAKTTSGSGQSVSLTVSGLPSGVTGSFNPTSVTTTSAGATSTLTLTAASTAPASSATSFTVRGAGTSATQTAGGSVTVTSNNPPPPPPTGGISNGDFETGSVSGWTSTGTATAVSGGHGGSYAARVGSTSPSTDSSLAQTFTAPSGATGLSLYYKVVCPDTLTYDWATVSLLDTTTGSSATVVQKTCSNSGAWVNATATVVAGHSYTLTLSNHDDNYSGDPTNTLFDDITITSNGPPPPPPPPPSGGLTNGDFEAGALTGWTTTGSTAAVSGQGHSGTYAARVGSTSPSTDSSISQSFTAPSGTTTLSLYYKVVCPDTITYDWATGTLKDTTAGTSTTIIAKTCSNGGAWVKASAAITAGHSYTLTLSDHDDNYSGDPTYTYYDDVTVQ
jgi:hypothetical protein